MESIGNTDLKIFERRVLEKIREYNDEKGISWNQIYENLEICLKEEGGKLLTALLDLRDQEMIQIHEISKDPANPFYPIRSSPIRITYKGRVYLSPLEKLHVLKRYKTLCEWYDQEKLFGEQETKITQNHLSRYLFDQGFTYSLAEVNTPSGRIDNIALNKEEMIVIEAKIYEKSKKNIQDVKNQLLKRLNDFQLNDGYCVVFNKSDRNLSLTSCEKDGVFWKYTENDKSIYILVVNLNKIFFQSTSDPKLLEISFESKKL